MCCEKEYCNAGEREMSPAVYIYKTGDYGLHHELRHGLQFHKIDADTETVSYIGKIKNSADSRSIITGLTAIAFVAMLL